MSPVQPIEPVAPVGPVGPVGLVGLVGAGQPVAAVAPAGTPAAPPPRPEALLDSSPPRSSRAARTTTLDGAGSCYELLGVSHHAALSQIARAYRTLAFDLRPDKWASADAERLFKLLGAAYETLSDPAARHKYNAFGENWLGPVATSEVSQLHSSVPPVLIRCHPRIRPVAGASPAFHERSSDPVR
eukprot:gene4285-biopygen4021